MILDIEIGIDSAFEESMLRTFVVTASPLRLF
jgi:hypothetical protein